jgi:hypothetical protein
MKTNFWNLAVLAGLALMAVAPALAQTAPATKNTAAKNELSINYTEKFAKYVGSSDTFHMPGGSIDFARHMGSNSSGFAFAVEVSGEGARNLRPQISLVQVSMVLGPRYYHSFAEGTQHPFRLYGLALQAGGGLDFALSSKLSWRITEADYLRTALPNSASNTQNDLRISSGLVIHF